MGAKVQDKPVVKESQRKKRALAVGALLGPLVEPALARKGAALAQVVPHWRAICPLLGEHSYPESLKGNVLTVAVASDAVKQELHYIAPQVAEGVNMLLGYAAVEKVRAVTRTGAGRKAPVSAPQAVAAGAGDKAGQVCKSVRDDGLRAALVGLGKLVLGK